MILLLLFIAILGAAGGYFWAKREDRATVKKAYGALQEATKLQGEIEETQHRQKKAGEILDRKKDELAEQESTIRQIARDVISGNYHPELYDDEARDKWLRDNEPPVSMDPRITVEEFTAALRKISGVNVVLKPGRGENNQSTGGN